MNPYLGLAIAAALAACVTGFPVVTAALRPRDAGARPPAHLDASLRSWAQACIDDKELKWDKEARRWRRELPRCEPTEEVCP